MYALDSLVPLVRAYFQVGFGGLNRYCWTSCCTVYEVLEAGAYIFTVQMCQNDINFLNFEFVQCLKAKLFLKAIRICSPVTSQWLVMQVHEEFVAAFQGLTRDPSPGWKVISPAIAG